MKDLLQRLLPVPRKGKLGHGYSLWPELADERRIVSGLGPEEYRLQVGSGRILVEAGSKRGFFLADQTIHQLKRLSPASCPDLRIEDGPALRIRGYMLDISRCKVPKMDHLYRLVDLLALLKYNQLQLYTEHTFAYRKHRVVWENASPLTAREIHKLKAYCAERFIELVPNQNAFGHMERWLKHDAYCELAESPDGFHHPITGWRPSGTVLYPDEKSIQFIDGLLNELLRCFDSQWVHLGCDEPWELGQGRSFERAQEVGRHQIFKEYVTHLHGLVSKRGKRMLFWSDELRQDPRRIREFPLDAIPVVWGYEGNHPFDEECSVYSAMDRPFLIAPGDSSWNSFTGRLDNAHRNIKRAAASAVDNQSLGMLLTSWGDNGHQQVWPAQLCGMLLFSAAAWNPGEVEALHVDQALNTFVFLDEEGGLGAFWEQIAKIDSFIPVNINPENSSFPYDALYQPAQKVRHAMKGESRDCLFNALDHLETCAKLLARANPASPDGKWLLEESQLAYDMTHMGLKRAEAILKGNMSLLDGIDCDAIVNRYQKVWLLRNRRGGLEESLAYISNCPNGSPAFRTD